MTICKICDGAAAPLFRADVLGKYPAAFFRCGKCGFIQSEEPHWLPEAYADAINSIDLGPVNRAIEGARVVESVILAHFDPAGRFIDYGAGYGVFVRLMRDRGYDFYWVDKHCANLFASHFVGSADQDYELVTSFEVFEHLADPIGEIEKMLTFGNNILFSTLLVPDGATGPANWWYFGVDHGQHIAFYTVDSLGIIADRFGLHFATNGSDTHLLSREHVSGAAFKRAVSKTRRATLVRKLRRRRHHVGSLLQKDFMAVSGYTL